MSFRADLITESRQKSANDKKQTPLRLFPENQSGIFASSEGGFYEATLEQCTCPDFAIQGHLQPCKHMIRLAMEFGIVDNSEMQSDRDAAVVKYHSGVLREFIKAAPLADIISSIRYFVGIAEHDDKVPEDAFEKSMDLPCISDCPMFKVLKNGTVRIEKKYSKEAQAIVTLMKHRIGEEATARLWRDDFVKAFLEE